MVSQETLMKLWSNLLKGAETSNESNPSTHHLVAWISDYDDFAELFTESASERLVSDLASRVSWELVR
jgi:hypothetical protein